MKRLLAFSVGLLALSGFAASPTYQQFPTNDFTTNGLVMGVNTNKFPTKQAVTNTYQALASASSNDIHAIWVSPTGSPSVSGRATPANPTSVIYDYDGTTRSGALVTATNGDTVYLLPGNYTSAAMPINDGVTIQGVGWPSIFHTNRISSTNNVFPMGSQTLWIVPGNNSKITGVTLITSNLVFPTFSSFFANRWLGNVIYDGTTPTDVGSGVVTYIDTNVPVPFVFVDTILGVTNRMATNIVIENNRMYCRVDGWYPAQSWNTNIISRRGLSSDPHWIEDSGDPTTHNWAAMTWTYNTNYVGFSTWRIVGNLMVGEWDLCYWVGNGIKIYSEGNRVVMTGLGADSSATHGMIVGGGAVVEDHGSKIECWANASAYAIQAVGGGPNGPSEVYLDGTRFFVTNTAGANTLFQPGSDLTKVSGTYLNVISNRTEHAGGLVVTNGFFTGDGAGLTNLLSVITNLTYGVPAVDTNSIYVTGAAVAGANGRYVFKANASGSRSFWTNTVPAFGIVYDTSDPAPNCDHFVITNSVGSPLYSTPAISSTAWDVCTSFTTTPFATYGTNYTTNIVTHSIYDPPFPTGTNVLYVNAKTGNDLFAAKGDALRPWASITNAAGAAASNDVLYIFPGNYTNGNLTLNDGVSILTPGSAFVKVWTTSGGDLALTPGKKSRVKGIGGNWNMAPGVRDIILEDIRTTCDIDNLLVGTTASNLIVLNCSFAVNGLVNSNSSLMDACVINVQSNFPAYFKNTEFVSIYSGSDTADGYRAVAAKQGTITFDNCRFVSKNGNPSVGIDAVQVVGQFVNVTIGPGCLFDVTSTNGNAQTITNGSSATVNIIGAGITRSSTSGGTVWLGSFASTNLFWITNSTPPADGTTIKAWSTIVFPDGAVWKAPLYK